MESNLKELLLSSQLNSTQKKYIRKMLIRLYGDLIEMDGFGDEAEIYITKSSKFQTTIDEQLFKVIKKQDPHLINLNDLIGTYLGHEADLPYPDEVLFDWPTDEENDEARGTLKTDAMETLEQIFPNMIDVHLVREIMEKTMKEIEFNEGVAFAFLDSFNKEKRRPN